jgi:hypothetical protein
MAHGHTMYRGQALEVWTDLVNVYAPGPYHVQGTGSGGLLHTKLSGVIITCHPDQALSVAVIVDSFWDWDRVLNQAGRTDVCMWCHCFKTRRFAMFGDCTDFVSPRAHGLCGYHMEHRQTRVLFYGSPAGSVSLCGLLVVQQ